MSEIMEDFLRGFQFYNPFKVLLYTNEIKNKEVVFVELHPATACNQRCVWCRYRGMSEGDILTKEQLFKILEKYPKVAGIRVTGGGEPLMNKHLPSFMKECKKRGIKTSLETNGALLTDESIRVIADCCQYVRLSLDAATPETYKMTHGVDDFQKVLSNIEGLSTSDLPEMGISYLVTRHNVWEIPKLENLKVKNHRFVLQPDYYHFKPLIEGIDPELKKVAIQKIKELERTDISIPIKYDRIIEDYHHNKKLPCEITKIIRVIGGDGKEYVCCEHAYEPDFEFSKWHDSKAKLGETYGETKKCIQCRYNPYLEVIDMYNRNTFTKEFL